MSSPIIACPQKRWRCSEGAGRTVVSEPVGTAGYEALVAAQSRALAAVSRDLAQALRELARASQSQ